MVLEDSLQKNVEKELMQWTGKLFLPTKDIYIILFIVRKNL